MMKFLASILFSVILSASVSAQSPYYNFNGSNLPHWDACKAAPPCTVVAIGESTTVNWLGTKAQAWPAQIAAKLSAAGMPAQSDSFFGNGRLDAAYPAYNTTVSLGAGWAWFDAPVFTGGNVAPGGPFAYNNGATTPLSFTSGTVADHYDLYFMENSAFTVNVDGGAPLATVTAATDNYMVKLTVSCTLGTHTLNIVPAGTGVVAFSGTVAYDSTHPKVSIINQGFGGALAAQWVDDAYHWTTGPNLTVTNQALSLVMLGWNDAVQNTSTTSFLASEQTLITRLKATGDVILIVGPPMSWTEVTPPSFSIIEAQNLYRELLYQLADTNNLPLIDLWWSQKRGPFAAKADSNGFYGDSAHGTAASNIDIAATVAEILEAH